MANIDANNIARLINQNKQYEGGGIAPFPQGGTRITTINNLKILRNQPQVGGAKITLTWNEESILPTDYFNIFVFSGYAFSQFTTAQTSLDTSSVLSTSLYQAPIVVQQAPAEIFISANQRIQVTLSVATRHSTGILSAPDFQSYVSVIVDPVTIFTKRLTVSGTADPFNPTLYLIDCTSGNVTLVLPDIAQMTDGFPIIVKKIDTSANSVSVQVTGTQYIDVATSIDTWNTAFLSKTYRCEKPNLLWWTV